MKKAFSNADSSGEVLRRLANLERRMDEKPQKSARRGKKVESKWEADEKVYEVVNRSQRRVEENVERVEKKLERMVDDRVGGL